MSLITEEQVVLDLTGADRHEATRTLAAHHDWERNVLRYQAIYQRLLGTSVEARVPAAA